MNSSGQETEQLTKATMGQGTVKNATDSTNRDINNTQEITRDQTTGMLDGSVTVDHRLLTEDGRKEIIQEQKDLPENLKQATKNLKNDVEKLVLKLPDSKIQNQILISINQMVGGDLIVDAYKDFLSNGGTKEEFFVVANNEYAQFYIQQLAEVNKKVKELEAQGYSLEQILNTSMRTTGNTNIISLNGQNEVNLTTDTTIGMELLTASYGLSKNYLDFQQEINEKYGVAIDPETLSLVIGTILTGPAKTVANVLISSQYGEYIETVKEKGVDLLATGITAASYGTSSETISIYTDPTLKETITNESQLTQDWSKDVSESKEGAKFLTNIIAGIVVGGSTKGKSNTTKIDGYSGKDVEVSTAGVGSRGKLTKPYDPNQTRKDLEAVHGTDNVKSMTVPPDGVKNVKLAGQRHPVTGVVFDKKGYPIFDDIAKYDTNLIQKGFNNLTYKEQMQIASKDLWSAIERGEVQSSQFNSKQLKQIESGSSKIDGFTWHHHQDQGRMQLVPEWEHAKTGHIGGDAMKSGK